MEKAGLEGVWFVQQLKTEKQTGNADSALDGCARTIMSRQNVTIAKNNQDADISFILLFSTVLSCLQIFHVSSLMRNENLEEN